MLESYQKHINQKLPFLTESKLLIAISGGLDSVVLTHLCHQANLNFALAHCNFNLRGSESDTDETFVVKLAEDLNLEVFVQGFNTDNFAKTHKLSTQMAARELRYEWFNDLCEQLEFDYILTAHHADDNLETFLINLSRATGLDGLTGIPEVNNNVVRPLLKFSRAEIETFAKENNIEWREDSSNILTKYLRNKLRHDVIPILKEVNPELLKNFEKTQSNLKESQFIIEDSINRVQKKVVKIEDDLIKFNIKKLQKLNNTKAYLFQLLKDFGFTQWNDVYNLLDAQSGKQVFSKTHRLLKDRKHLILTKISSERSKEELFISKDTKSLKTAIGILILEESQQINQPNKSTIFVDKNLLKHPLTVRKWKKGDYFYPFGMKGKKKLSKFFKDEKLSLVAKENIWLLCSGNNIVWIINKRADNRYRVANTTNNILKITLK